MMMTHYLFFRRGNKFVCVVLTHQLQCLNEHLYCHSYSEPTSFFVRRLAYICMYLCTCMLLERIYVYNWMHVIVVTCNHRTLTACVKFNTHTIMHSYIHCQLARNFIELRLPVFYCFLLQHSVPLVRYQTLRLMQVVLKRAVAVVKVWGPVQTSLNTS